MKAHRLAKYFPILEGEEFDLLVEDIEKNGQLEPIVTVNGEILDGVNRYRACQQLGIDVIVEEYTGDDPLGYVVSINIRRRHMDENQRSMLSVEMLPEYEKEAKQRQGRKIDLTSAPDGAEVSQKDHRAVDDAAKQFGVSPRRVQRAKRVKEKRPEKVDDIIAGKETIAAIDAEISIEEAGKRAAEKKDKQEVKTAKEHPKYVKEYLDAIVKYKEALKQAIIGAKHTRLAPEAAQFIITRHNQLGGLMEELEEFV